MAKPKWIPGDYALCLQSCTGQFTAGKVYKIRSVETYKGSLRIQLGIELDDSGSIHNGWVDDFFKRLGRRLSKLEKEIYNID